MIKKLISLQTIFLLTLSSLLLLGCSSDESNSDTSLESKGYASIDKLVSTSWVEERLDDKNLKIIDIRLPEDYAAGHIPDSVNLSYKELQVERDGVKGLIPSENEMATKLSALGIKDTDTIVVVDHIKNLWSSRLLWTLEVYGHEDTKLMDGSYALWESEGKKITSDSTSISSSKYSFTGEAKPELIISLQKVMESIDDEASIVLDTRSADEYAGRDVRAERGGHIPESIHVEWVQNVDADGRFLPAEDLKNLYNSTSVTNELDIYTLCQTAVRATHSWFVLQELLGYDNVAVYDGSWTEWGNLENTPIDS